MKKYELTDLGKIIIAVVLVFLLLLLPSALLVFKTMAAQPPPSTDKQESEASGALPPNITEPTPSEIKDSPPPHGGGLVPEDATPAQSPGSSPGTSQGEPSGAPQQTPNGTHEGPPPDPADGYLRGSVDPLEGTLSFLFSPGIQSDVGPEISAMIGEFLSSPRNTLNSVILVEMPTLSHQHADVFIDAIVEAFKAQDVGEQRLAFSMLPAEPSDEPFMANLRYLPQQGK